MLWIAVMQTEKTTNNGCKRNFCKRHNGLSLRYFPQKRLKMVLQKNWVRKLEDKSTKQYFAPSLMGRKAEGRREWRLRCRRMNASLRARGAGLPLIANLPPPPTSSSSSSSWLGPRFIFVPQYSLGGYICGFSQRLVSPYGAQLRIHFAQERDDKTWQTNRQTLFHNIYHI